LALSGRRVAWAALGAAALWAAAPRTGGAQFGALQKLKQAAKAVSGPDSAARARDSVARVQNVSAGDVVAAADSTKGKSRSLFRRAAAAAGKASDTFEKTTGVSVTDAALAASGAGLAGIAAKKMGVDPASLASRALATQQSPATLALPDAQLMLDFQRQMMLVATEATTGNAAARAKLDAWTALSLQYETEAVPLTTAMSGGDMAAYAKLQALQTKMMRAWLYTYGTSVRPQRARPQPH
jgi:hypothetical protein